MRLQKTCSAGIVLILALAGVSVPLARSQVTNWIAYNDHRPSTTPVANGWPATRAYVTGIELGVGPGSLTGNLLDFRTGNALPVVLTAAAAGSPNDFGSITRPLPTNSPMGQIFYGICDFANDGIVGVDKTDTANNQVILTFSNLDPGKRYQFRGSSARNGGYAPRWTLATINAASWVDAHLNGTGPGVITARAFTNLTAGQAAWNSGHNAQGAVVAWDAIAPLPDGTFSIVQEQYVGPTPNGGQALIANYGYAFSGVSLAEVESFPPQIVEQPATQTTVEQNRPFALRVGATGTPLLYQWYRTDSGEIAEATAPTLAFASAALSDSGNYYAVVYNELRRSTSSVARVTVNADVAPPGIAVAFPYPTVTGGVATHDQIIIEFSEPVQAASVESPSRYVVPGGGNPVSVVVTNSRTVVLTLASPLAEDTAYSVSASGMTDEVGNTAGSVSAPFRTWASGPGNGLVLEAFDTGPGVEVTQLTGSPNYPNNPSQTAVLGVFDTRTIFPTDDKGDYGARIRGVFIPPVSGNWLFYLRTYQRGVVYLNPDGLDPAGAVEILRESTGNEPRNWDKFTSPIQSLRAGQGYYIEAQYKADTSGADVIKVAARLAGTGFPQPVDVLNTDVDSNAISGAAIGYPLAPRDLGGPLTIVSGPASITVEDNHTATFSVKLNNPGRAAVFYQWFRDGSPIAVAGNGPTYSFRVTPGDSGATFSVQVAKIGSSAVSGTATLTVLPDTTLPRAVAASSPATNLNEVVVVFDELVTVTDAEDEFNYSLGTGENPNSAVMDPDGKTARLTFAAALVQGDSYQIDVANVTDLAGLAMVSTRLDFVAGVVEGPSLAIERNGGSVAISWTASATGFVLEQADAIVLPVSAMAWSPAGVAPTVVNGRNTVTLPVAGNRVFRLRQ